MEIIEIFYVFIIAVIALLILVALIRIGYRVANWFTKEKKTPRDLL